MSTSISVMTYNTQGSLGMDAVRSTERIAEVVLAAAPDIVCFQEIHQRSPLRGMEDQPKRLGKLLGKAFLFHKLLHFGLGGYGIGMASSLPILSSRQYLLPEGDERRGLLEVVFQGANGASEFRVCCTHWGLTPQERLAQARKCAEVLNARRIPTLFCGDLNEGAQAAGVETVLRETRLQDSSDGSLTFPSLRPTTRIDYILHSSEWRRKRFETIDSPASDHCAVFAEFERD
jgi:endonuclease/exonuclease/phosphatase family metal-dependent hydrolase